MKRKSISARILSVTLTAAMVLGSFTGFAKINAMSDVNAAESKKLIADFSFDGTADGFKGAGAVAVPHAKEGESNLFNYVDKDGKSGLEFDKTKWLEVKKENGEPLLKGVEEFTVSYDSCSSGTSDRNGWAFFLTNTYEEGMATNGNSEKHPRFSIVDYASILRTCCTRYANSAYSSTNTNAAVTANVWKHIDVVFSASGATIYVDGVKTASDTNDYAALKTLANGEESYIWIGKGPFKDGSSINQQLFSGYLANYKIYNYALNESEINSVPVSDFSIQGVTSVETGGNLRLSIIAEPENAGYQDVVWSSSDPTIAGVDDKGHVTAVAEGTTTITVTIRDKEDIKSRSVDVTVSPVMK